MSTNVFFSKGTPNEQHLYEDLAIEAIQIYGHDVFYLPREMLNIDELFGEDALSKFDDAYGIEMWMETQEGFEGEKELVSRFGLEIRDETTFVVSRRRWDQVASQSSNLISTTRPNEGDLVYMPTVKRLFEISFVDHDDPFYQIDNLPVYKLYCRTFEYSSEVLDTGIAGIDAIEDKRSLDQLIWQFLGEQGPTTIFNQQIDLEFGTVYGNNIAGTIGAGVIELENATDGAGSQLLGENETGFEAVLTESSTAEYNFFIINESYSVATQAPQSDNEFLETEALSILDFTETNPFGEPTDST